MKKRNTDRTAWKYLITALLASVIFVFCAVLRNTLLNNIFIFNRIFRTVPFMSVCVAVPFYIFAVLRAVFKRFYGESSCFYVCLLICMAALLVYELYISADLFNILDFLAGVNGLYAAMVIQGKFNEYRPQPVAVIQNFVNND